MLVHRDVQPQFYFRRVNKGSHARQDKNLRGLSRKGNWQRRDPEHARFWRDGVERRGRAPACHSFRGD